MRRGLGFRRGWGRGHYGAGFGGWTAPGWGWGTPEPGYGYAGAPPESAGQEIEGLKAQAGQLEAALESIRRRIEQLEASESSEAEG